MHKEKHVCLFYSSEMGEYAHSIRQAVENTCGYAETYRSVHSLEGRLKLSLHDIVGIVLVIRDENEFERISAIRDLLSDIAVFIALDSPQRGLVMKCHKLHPRMVDVGGDQATVESVLKSMYRRHMEESGVGHP
jgi:hypothetical protein